MEPNSCVTIDFTNVKWLKFSLPNHLNKCVRCEFLLDRDGKAFSNGDLKDILSSYLYDEYNVVPLDFEFKILPC